jgi:hypothetical protein
MKNIKDIWIKIWEYLKPILKVKSIISFFTSKTFLVILIIVFVLMLGRSCAKNRDDRRIINIKDQNIIALNDKIKIENRKNGNLESTIAGYVVSEKHLKELNENLFNEIKNEKGKVISLNRVVFGMEQNALQLKDHINYLESIMDDPIQLNDSTFKILWMLAYDWDSINFDRYFGETIVGLTIKPGYTWRDAIMSDKIFASWGSFNGNNIIGINHQQTYMTYRTSQVEMVFGQKAENGQLRVFVTTKYPGFTAKSLEGVLIDPNTNPYIKNLMKKKKWIPNTWSVGVGPSFGYDVLTLKPYLGIGVTINYNLLQW